MRAHVPDPLFFSYDSFDSIILIPSFCHLVVESRSSSGQGWGALASSTGIRISPELPFVRLSNDFFSCARTQRRYLLRRKNGGAMRTPDWGGARIRDRFLSLWTPHRRSIILAGGYKQLPVSLATYRVARELESHPNLESFDLRNIVKIGVFHPRYTSCRPRTKSELRISRQCAV